jgi:hypothetical protein
MVLVASIRGLPRAAHRSGDLPQRDFAIVISIQAVQRPAGVIEFLRGETPARIAIERPEQRGGGAIRRTVWARSTVVAVLREGGERCQQRKRQGPDARAARHGNTTRHGYPLDPRCAVRD